MRQWRVHLVWAIVTVVVGAAVARIVAPDRGADNPRAARESDPEIARLRARVAELEAAPRPMPAVAAQDPVPLPDPPEVRSKDKKKAPPEEPLTDEQILALLSGKDPWGALKAIAGMTDRGRKLALLRQALIHPEEKVRREALKQAAALGGPEAVELVLGAFQADASPRVRNHAAWLLGDLGAGQALPALQAAWRDAEARWHSITLANALRKLGDPAPHEALVAKHGLELRNPDGGLRREAVGSLKDLGTPIILPYLQQALGDSNSDVRLEAVDALRESGSPEAVALLERAVADPNPDVSRHARSAIDWIRNPSKKK